jgi:hypothetical protein
MARFFIILALLASLAALSAVAQSHTPPAPILEAARRVFRDSLGPDIANRIVSPLDSARLYPIDSSCAPARAIAVCGWPWDRRHWLLYYHLDPAADSTRRAQVILPLDEQGQLLPDYQPDGLPPCAREPDACDFRIGPDSAAALARTAGFPQGVSPWSITLRWLAPTYRVGPAAIDPRGDPPTGTKHWAWAVATTTYLAGAAIRGRTLWLNAATGEIIGESSWGGMF